MLVASRSYRRVILYWSLSFMVLGAVAGVIAFLLGLADAFLRLGIGIGLLEAVAALGFAFVLGSIAVLLKGVLKLV